VDFEYIEALLFVTWAILLFFWISMYINVQLDRVNADNAKYFHKERKRLIVQKEDLKQKMKKRDTWLLQYFANGFLLYFGISVFHAPYLYPRKSLAIWIILVGATFL
jgi:hypothetical protein